MSIAHNFLTETPRPDEYDDDSGITESPLAWLDSPGPATGVPDTGGHLAAVVEWIERTVARVEAAARTFEPALLEPVVGQPMSVHVSDDTTRQIDEWRQTAEQRLEQLIAIEKVVSKSTSKVSLEVKAILRDEDGQAPADPEPAGIVVTEPDPVEPPEGRHTPVEWEQPDAGAPIDTWRAYARTQPLPENADVDNANRSQIRTWLGLSHFSGPSSS